MAIIILIIPTTAQTVCSLHARGGRKLVTQTLPSQELHGSSGGGHWDAEQVINFSEGRVKPALKPYRLAPVCTTARPCWLRRTCELETIASSGISDLG